MKDVSTTAFYEVDFSQSGLAAGRMILFGNRAKPSFSARNPSIRRRLLNSRTSRRLPRGHPERATRHHDLDSGAGRWRKLYSPLWHTPDGVARILPCERYSSPDLGFCHTV